MSKRNLIIFSFIFILFMLTSCSQNTIKSSIDIKNENLVNENDSDRENKEELVEEKKELISNSVQGKKEESVSDYPQKENNLVDTDYISDNDSEWNGHWVMGNPDDIGISADLIIENATKTMFNFSISAIYISVRKNEKNEGFYYPHFGDIAGTAKLISNNQAIFTMTDYPDYKMIFSLDYDGINIQEINIDNELDYGWSPYAGVNVRFYGDYAEKAEESAVSQKEPDTTNDVTKKKQDISSDNDIDNQDYGIESQVSEGANLIVVNDILLGAYIKGAWKKATEIKKLITGEEEYKAYSINKFLGDFIGDKINLLEPCDTESINIKADKSYNVAIKGNWNALPRVPEEIDINSEVYTQIVSDILKLNDLDNIEVNIKQIYRIDLEGDGVDEVLINASNIDFDRVNVTQMKDTYSIIILRKIIDGKVENIILRESIYTKDGTFSDGVTVAYNITSFVDANGDGSMEFILESRYYEGFSYYLFEEKNNQFNVVLSNGWGV